MPIPFIHICLLITVLIMMFIILMPISIKIKSTLIVNWFGDRKLIISHLTKKINLQKNFYKSENYSNHVL